MASQVQLALQITLGELTQRREAVHSRDSFALRSDEFRVRSKLEKKPHCSIAAMGLFSCTRVVASRKAFRLQRSGCRRSSRINGDANSNRICKKIDNPFVTVMMPAIFSVLDKRLRGHGIFHFKCGLLSAWSEGVVRHENTIGRFSGIGVFDVPRNRIRAVHEREFERHRSRQHSSCRRGGRRDRDEHGDRSGVDGKGQRKRRL